VLPTFVIGLREGLEAALIVGILAAFLRKQGRRDLVRWVFAGVAVAVGLCLAAGIALDLYSRDLPQRQQEGLETVIGVLAVGMVTYMVVWMRRHSRQLKGQLEDLAAGALDGRASAGRAMVAMAFLAVIREGLETVVFLLAAFNESGSGAGSGVGAMLGIVVAAGLGYGIYRGGVRLNLSKFFRATGLVLVFVAAGLVVNALHTAHEAGWLNAGQGATVDLSWLVQPGSVQASLLTGMLGIQAHPVVIEAIGWLIYLVPVGCYVAWPPGRAVATRAIVRVATATAVVTAAAAVLLAVLAPGRPPDRPRTSGAGISALIVSRSGASATVRTGSWPPASGTTGSVDDVRLTSSGLTQHRGAAAEVFRAVMPAGVDAARRPAALDRAAVARLNSGRLPIGLVQGTGSVPVTYTDARSLTVWLDPRTDRILDLVWTERVSAAVALGSGHYRLPAAVAERSTRLPASTVAAARVAARSDHAQLDRRSLVRGLAACLAALAGGALFAALGSTAAAARRSRSVVSGAAPARDHSTVSG
jgi:high-affinity iron transporter